jgi:hypothetical protein
VCAFSGGARCSALGVGPAPVPGTRSQVPDSRYPIPGTGHQAECPSHASKNPHTGYARCRIGRVRILATWYPGPGTWHPCPIPTSQIFRSCAVGWERIQAIRGGGSAGGRRKHRPPRSRYSFDNLDRLPGWPPKASDRWLPFGPPRRRPRPAGCADIGPSTSRTFRSFRPTKLHNSSTSRTSPSLGRPQGLGYRGERGGFF